MAVQNIEFSSALGVAFDVGHIRKLENTDPLETETLKPEGRARFNNLLCCFFYGRWPDKYIKFRHILSSKEGEFIIGNPSSCKIKYYEFEGLSGEKYLIDGKGGIYVNENGNPLLLITQIADSKGNECYEHICYFELDEESVIPPGMNKDLSDDSLCYPRLEQDKKDLVKGKELYSGPMFHGGI